MAAKVVVKATGESLLGKFAVIEGDRVGSFRYHVRQEAHAAL